MSRTTTALATALATGALLLSGAAAHAQGKPASGDSGFQPSASKFADAYNKGDADTLLGMYADDAVVMPPGHPLVTGKQAMRPMMEKDMAELKDAKLSLKIDEGTKGSSGDLGWHSGTYMLVGADGKAANTGKYLEVWQRRDGKWHIIRDIWNHDTEAKAGMSHDGMSHDGMSHDAMPPGVDDDATPQKDQ